MPNSLHSLSLLLVPALEETGPLGGSTGPDLTRYFTVCGVLILVTIAIAWGLRRLLAGNLKLRASQRSLQVLDALSLGGKKRLAVVRCYDRTFVLGLGEREITPVAELDPASGAEPQPVDPSKPDQAAFAQALEHVRAAMPSGEFLGRRLAQTKDTVEIGAQTPEPAPEAARPAPTAPKAEQAPEAPKKAVVRRKVRRKVSSKSTAATRKIEAQAVASAAHRLAEQKKRQEHKQRSPQEIRADARAAIQRGPESTGLARTGRPGQEAQAPIQRLEGILG